MSNACFAQVPGAVADVIFEVEDEMGGEDGAARHDAALSALGIPAELVHRLRQRSREHKQQAATFKRGDWEQIVGRPALQLPPPQKAPGAAGIDAAPVAQPPGPSAKLLEGVADKVDVGIDPGAPAELDWAAEPAAPADEGQSNLPVLDDVHARFAEAPGGGAGAAGEGGLGESLLGEAEDEGTGQVRQRKARKEYGSDPPPSPPPLPPVQSGHVSSIPPY